MPIDSNGFSRTIFGANARNPELKKVREPDSLSNFVIVVRIATPLSLENWLKEHAEFKTRRKNITVGGKPAVQTNDSLVGETYGNNAITTLVKNNGDLLIISVLMTPQKEQEVRGLYSKMLTSLKFNLAEKKETEVDTSDWKTYKHPTVGFSFKLPPDWRRIKEENESVTFRSYSTVERGQGGRDEFGEIETELKVSLTKKGPTVEEKAAWDKIQKAKIGEEVNAGDGFLVKKLKLVNMDDCQAIAIYGETEYNIHYGVICVEVGKSGGFGFSPENTQIFEKNQSIYDAIVSTFRFK